LSLSRKRKPSFSINKKAGAPREISKRGSTLTVYSDFRKKKRGRKGGLPGRFGGKIDILIFGVHAAIPGKRVHAKCSERPHGRW